MFRHDGKVYEHISTVHGTPPNRLIHASHEDNFCLWGTNAPEKGIKDLIAFYESIGMEGVTYVVLETACMRWIVTYDLMDADGDTTEHASGPYYTFAEASVARSGFEKLENFLGASVIPLEK